MVGNIIEGKEVGSGFLYGAAMHTKSICIYARKNDARTMSEAFVQVGVQVIQLVSKIVNHLQHIFIGNEFLTETIAFGRIIISFGEIANGHALATMHRANPVAIRQIDANGRTGVKVATQYGSLHHTSSNALAFLLLETLVYRAVVLKPLSILAKNLSALCGFLV